MGADDRDDVVGELLPPVRAVRAVRADDVDRQGQEEAAKPEQGIGKGEIVLVGGREQKEERQACRPIEQDVDLVAEDVAVLGRGERPRRTGIVRAPSGQQGGIDDDIQTSQDARVRPARDRGARTGRLPAS
mgnify:FL=1